MSAAAVHPASPPTSTQIPLAPSSTTNRQYSQQARSKDSAREPLPQNTQSPTASRRAARRASNASGAVTAAAPYAAPPPFTTSSTNDTRTDRYSSPISPITAPPSGHPNAAPLDNQRGQPPVAPPRSSSQKQRETSTAPAAAASASGRARRDPTMESRHGGTSGVIMDDGVGASRTSPRSQTDRIDAAAAAVAATRARRKESAQDAVANRTTTTANRETRTGPPISSHSREQGISSTTISTSEPGTVKARIVVSNPAEDLEREQARMKEAIPVNGRDPSDYDAIGNDGIVEEIRGNRSRQDHSASNKRAATKDQKFGDYYLGNTLGEGEFGKVKLGFKQEGGVQVAIKLIRKDSVGTNPTRLAKIYREIAILREIVHPNIVRLHEMVENDKHIGIILEYASGGELFDYILNHRYLKDNTAKRLFAQLISGVGYLHKKGVVHRDLKLENLLLDRNRNIIISDFGFANTFNPHDELSDEIEHNLISKDYVKESKLDRILPSGFRRGDLMQTSCGSPCYAAPELVVSDSLYTGRKVDVWSCGVILYAMLAGYLPFDDDPANPEGDNINLLYKYIVTTPLTFPEYVTPHARDLLRRILVADPRKRADLFEVARHSWLSDYAHVVEGITSITTTQDDFISGVSNTMLKQPELPLLGRSASVREPNKTKQSQFAGTGDLIRKHGGHLDPEGEGSLPHRSKKDDKRRTVQVEYVAPTSQTVRGQDVPTTSASSRSRARSGSQGPTEVASTSSPGRRAAPLEQAQSVAQRSAHYSAGSSKRGPGSSDGNMPPPASIRNPPRSVSDNAFMQSGTTSSTARPATGGSMASMTSGRQSLGLQTRGSSYGQPLPPSVAGTTAQGRMSQPPANSYSQAGSQADDLSEHGRQSINNVPDKFAKVSGFNDSNKASRQAPPQSSNNAHGHKRTNTVGSLSDRLFGRRGSVFSASKEKNSKKYPPVSMSSQSGAPRPSVDSSRRSISFGFGRKRSGSLGAGSGSGNNLAPSEKQQNRRFSFLQAIGLAKDNDSYESQPRYDTPDMDQPYPHNDEHNSAIPVASMSHSQSTPAVFDTSRHIQSSGPQTKSLTASQQRITSTSASSSVPMYRNMTGNIPAGRPSIDHTHAANSDRQQNNTPSTFTSQPQRAARYPEGFNDYDETVHRKPNSSGGIPNNNSNGRRGVLQKGNRRFEDAYEGPQGSRQNAASTGAAKKVMDFFRRRGRDRAD